MSETYWKAWSLIPPHCPQMLGPFLGKIARRIALDRWRYNHSGKRGGGELPAVLSELEECLAGRDSTVDTVEEQELASLLREFVQILKEPERSLFLSRYWFFESIASLAKRFSFTESKTTSMLFRIRKKLRRFLEKEGY